MSQLNLHAMQQTVVQFATGLALGAAGRELRRACSIEKNEQLRYEAYTPTRKQVKQKFTALSAVVTLGSLAANWCAYYKVPNALAYVLNESKVQPLTNANKYAIMLGFVLGQLNLTRAVYEGAQEANKEFCESEEISLVKNLKNSLGKACLATWKHLSVFEKTKE